MTKSLHPQYKSQEGYEARGYIYISVAKQNMVPFKVYTPSY